MKFPAPKTLKRLGSFLAVATVFQIADDFGGSLPMGRLAHFISNNWNKKRRSEVHTTARLW